jgi:hypothetical protein
MGLPGATLFRLGEVIQGSGAARREGVCRANYDVIGAFPERQRRRLSGLALEVNKEIAEVFGRDPGEIDDTRRLRGRPWHPCDWRGALSPEGWAQALRYWAVRLGANWDYAADECTRPHRGFGCPARR